MQEQNASLYRQYAVIFSPYGSDEFPSRTCHHCNAIAIAKPQQSFRNRAGFGDLGRVCRECREWICDHCATSGGCDPWEEQLKRIEEA